MNFVCQLAEKQSFFAVSGGNMAANVVVVVMVALVMCGQWRVYAKEQRLLVKMNLVRNAAAIGACKSFSSTKKIKEKKLSNSNFA